MMFYLVNKRTKEHRRYEDAIDWPDSDCQLVQANADGWIPWNGDRECPLPGGSECDVKHRSGDVFDNTFAGSTSAHNWSHTYDVSDIIAYRPILNTMPDAARCEYCDGTGDVHSPDGEWRGECTVCKLGVPEWDGSGLPPVGCECECKRYPSGREWVDCKVVGHDLEDGFYVAVARVGSEYLGLPMVNFRPIRTAAQRAEDFAIEDMLAESMADEERHLRAVFRNLYRAGYRKIGGSNHA